MYIRSLRAEHFQYTNNRNKLEQHNYRAINKILNIFEGLKSATKTTKRITDRTHGLLRGKL